jgi:hypothetical protein
MALAFADVKRDAVQRLDAGEILGDALALDDGSSLRQMNTPISWVLAYLPKLLSIHRYIVV